MEKNELIQYKTKTNYNLGQLELDYYQHLILSRLFEKFNTIVFDLKVFCSTALISRCVKCRSILETGTFITNQ